MSKFSPDLLSAPADKIFYALTMFPYPSGVGLHAGHASVFTINDVVARYKTMSGYTVLNPFGFDAFGLPTENYALQENKGAREVTDTNKAMFLDQVKALNISFDYERIVDTSMPDYYRWTQWIFTKLMEAGLVYRDEKFVNRCPVDQTVLANDQVVDGCCERCKSEIIQKKHMQRFIKITDYADRLISDLDLIDRPEETKTTQKNWIGRSEGAEIDFQVGSSLSKEGNPQGGGLKTLTVFTTRPDTLYGVTAIVLAPENTLIDELLSEDKKSEVQSYRNTALAKTAVQRQQDVVDKTGVFSGLYAIHPLTGEQVPVWFADYVLMDYGSGAVMMVPAHDERDREFAHKFGIEVKQVIRPFFDIFSNKDTTETITRNGVLGIIKHPFEDKYLVLEENQSDFDQTFYFFPSGGIEEADLSTQDTLKREIVEETGYTDIGDIVELNSSLNYIRGSKERNYTGRYIGYAVQLNSLTQIDQGEHMTDKHNILWLTAEEISQKVTERQQLYFWNSYNSGYTGTGILINSAQFDGMDSTEAKSAIIAHLESLGCGKKKITYRLRDRSVSRQRYRGSPIPVYYTFEDISEVPFFDNKDHLLSVRKEKPIISRNMVGVIIQHPSENKYLLMKRNDFGKYTTLSGGIDNNEDPKSTIQREIKEETGYFDIESINSLDHQIHFQQYAPHKNINRYGITDLYLVKLKSLNQKEINKVESDQHTFEWIDFNEVSSKIDLELIKYIRDYYLFKIHNFSKPQIINTINRYNAYNPHPDRSKRIAHPIPESELPVILPLDVTDFKPKGKSPLEDHPTFKYYEKDGKTYLRECDTLDTFMCSSFYFLRFPDAHNDEALIRKELADKCLPVDFYSGGKEHSVGHLLYSRFIHKFLYDQGYVSSPEPFMKLVHQGMVLGADGRKMGKRYNNGVDPLEIVQKYGSDAVRTYLMFMGPIEADKVRNDNALNGIKKFLDRVEKLPSMEWYNTHNDDVIATIHDTIIKVTEDIEQYKFNTAVSKIMIAVNTIYDHKSIDAEHLGYIAQLLAPFAPTLAQQLWEQTGHESEVAFSVRPVADTSKITMKPINFPIQINGKMRGTLSVAAGISEGDLMDKVLADETISKYLTGTTKKVIFVADKIMNIINN